MRCTLHWHWLLHIIDDKFVWKVFLQVRQWSRVFSNLHRPYLCVCPGVCKGSGSCSWCCAHSDDIEKKNTSNEKDGAGAFQQPETCCGSCNDNILTTIKRLSKLLELALASVCQCSFSYLIMEWSESLVQLWTVMDSFSLDCLRCWGQDSRCSSMWARGLWWRPLVSSSATQPPHSLAALSR